MSVRASDLEVKIYRAHRDRRELRTAMRKVSTLRAEIEIDGHPACIVPTASLQTCWIPHQNGARACHAYQERDSWASSVHTVATAYLQACWISCKNRARINPGNSFQWISNH